MKRTKSPTPHQPAMAVVHSTVIVACLFRIDTNVLVQGDKVINSLSIIKAFNCLPWAPPDHHNYNILETNTVAFVASNVGTKKNIF